MSKNKRYYTDSQRQLSAGLPCGFGAKQNTNLHADERKHLQKACFEIAAARFGGLRKDDDA